VTTLSRLADYTAMLARLPGPDAPRRADSMMVGWLAGRVDQETWDDALASIEDYLRVTT
jgi:hypothetical protein